MADLGPSIDLTSQLGNICSLKGIVIISTEGFSHFSYDNIITLGLIFRFLMTQYYLSRSSFSGGGVDGVVVSVL
jgi:hypothetical protein